MAEAEAEAAGLRKQAELDAKTHAQKLKLQTEQDLADQRTTIDKQEAELAAQKQKLEREERERASGAPGGQQA